MPEDLLGKLIAEIHVRDLTGRDIKPATKNFEKMTNTGKTLSSVTKRLNKETGRMRGVITSVDKKFTSLELASDKYGYTQAKIRRGAEELNAEVNQQGEFISKTTKKKIDETEVTNGLRKANMGFRMELLSVMFFGMAIQRTFGGMIKQVMELTGVFDVWKAVLTMILLPILLPFSRVLMQIMFYIMQHPLLGKFVGWFIILAATLGAILAYFGTVYLGFLGLAKLGFEAPLKAFEEIFGWLVKIIIKPGWDLLINFLKDPLGTIATIYVKLAEIMNKAWDVAIKFIQDPIGTITSILAWLNKLPKVIQIAIVLTVGFLLGGAAARLGEWLREKFPPSKYPFLKDLEGLIQELAKGPWGVGTPIWEKASELLASSPTYQYGGFVPRTGMYKLHAGENVTPAGGLGGGGMTVNVNAAISSEMDVKRLADRISIEMGRNLEREYGRRAI